MKEKQKPDWKYFNNVLAEVKYLQRQLSKNAKRVEQEPTDYSEKLLEDQLKALQTRVQELRNSLNPKEEIK
jgi:hypothetical protein